MASRSACVGVKSTSYVANDKYYNTVFFRLIEKIPVTEGYHAALEHKVTKAVPRRLPSEL